MDKMWAVRGATTIPEDTGEAVLTATRELLAAVFAANRIHNDALVSIQFTVTPDIHSEFPAVAARQIGLTDTPLTCAQEMDKAGALPLCIRVLICFYTSLTKAELQPVYLRDAVRLRPDLAKDAGHMSTFNV